jgi:hypothetical protein
MTTMSRLRRDIVVMLLQHCRHCRHTLKYSARAPRTFSLSLRGLRALSRSCARRRADLTIFSRCRDNLSTTLHKYFAHARNFSDTARRRAHTATHFAKLFSRPRACHRQLCVGLESSRRVRADPASSSRGRNRAHTPRRLSTN